MKNNLVYSYITFIILLLLMYASNDLFSQNLFSYEEIEKRRKIGLLKYDGSKKSIADGEVTALQGFTFLSVGRLKKVSSVSNGCVYVLVEYPKKQFILIKSNPAELSNRLKGLVWKDIDEDDLDTCILLTDRIETSDKRMSSYKEKDSYSIAILNIRKQDEALFQYMVDTIVFH